MQKSLRKYILPIGIVAALALIILLLVLILGKKSGNANGSETSDISAGVSFLKSLEAEDPGKVDAIRKEQMQQRLLMEREEFINKLDSGEISVWSLFEDYVLMGDSRAVAFSYNGFLAEDRVLADGGATIMHLRDCIPFLITIRPSNIFLCYGLNDICIGNWPTPQEYVADYAQILLEIRQYLPDARFYINSILPVDDPAFLRSAELYRISEYNDAIRVMCEGIDNCFYIDNDGVSERHLDAWNDDGIHMGSAFYPLWAANMIATVYMGPES